MTFLTFDASLDLGSARTLLADLDAGYAVVRLGAGPSFAVVEPSVLLDADHSDDATLADVLGDVARALVLDTDDGCMTDLRAARRGHAHDAVLVDDHGIVAQVFPNLDVAVGGGGRTVRRRPLQLGGNVGHEYVWLDKALLRDIETVAIPDPAGDGRRRRRPWRCSFPTWSPSIRTPRSAPGSRRRWPAHR